MQFGRDAGKVIYKPDTPSTMEYLDPASPFVWTAENPNPPPARAPPPELEFVEEGTYVVRALSCGQDHEDSIVTTHTYHVKVGYKSIRTHTSGTSRCASDTNSDTNSLLRY